MSLPGFIVAGLTSAAGGGTLVALIASSFAEGFPALLGLVSVGALGGSVAGWYIVKGRDRLFWGSRTPRADHRSP